MELKQKCIISFEFDKEFGFTCGNVLRKIFIILLWTWAGEIITTFCNSAIHFSVAKLDSTTLVSVLLLLLLLLLLKLLLLEEEEEEDVIVVIILLISSNTEASLFVYVPPSCISFSKSSCVFSFDILDILDDVLEGAVMSKTFKVEDNLSYVLFNSFLNTCSNKIWNKFPFFFSKSKLFIFSLLILVVLQTLAAKTWIALMAARDLRSALDKWFVVLCCDDCNDCNDDDCGVDIITLVLSTTFRNIKKIFDFSNNNKSSCVDSNVNKWIKRVVIAVEAAVLETVPVETVVPVSPVSSPVSPVPSFEYMCSNRFDINKNNSSLLSFNFFFIATLHDNCSFKIDFCTKVLLELGWSETNNAFAIGIKIEAVRTMSVIGKLNKVSCKVL